jgi:hypothetical protein
MNMVLAGAVVFFGYQTLEVWIAREESGVTQPVPKPPGRRTQRRIAYRRNPPYRTYNVIAQRNLFSSDRRERLPETPATPSPVMPSRPLDPRFALFGIVVDGDEKKALVSNLDMKTATEKKYIWVKVGDKIGSLNIFEIGPEEVTITEQGSTHVIRLSDQSYPQRRSGARKVSKPAGTNVIEVKKQKAKSPAAVESEK